MSELNILHTIGGAAGILVGSQTEPDNFRNTRKFRLATGVSLLVIAVVVVFVVLFCKFIYWMFPENKGLHVFLTLILGLFWVIPAILYYLFVVDGYHMKGFKIVKK